MKLQRLLQKKIDRKNFFYSLGAGVAGYVAMKSFPFKYIGKKLFSNEENNNKVLVKINPFAVSRKKIGGNNG